jgi:charged multivesicular body protein 2A
MAMDVVRTRRHIQKMYQMKTRLQAISLRLQTVQSQAAMAEAMKGVTRAMVRMNRQINLPALQQIMMEFEKQSQIMDMKDEAISDTSGYHG